MDPKKVPTYIKNLKDQRLKLKEMDTALNHLTESVKWINNHTTDEMIEMELGGIIEALRHSDCLLKESLNLNRDLEDEIRKPPADLIRMLKGKHKPKAVEEYEEI